MTIRLTTFLLIAASPGLLGAQAVAAPPDWRTAVAALAGVTPGSTSVASLYRVAPALGADSSSAATKAAATLGADADNRFLGDGVRYRTAGDELAVGVHEGVAAGVLTAALTQSGDAATPRTQALVHTLQASIRSARDSVSDARRVVGAPPAASRVPVIAEPSWGRSGAPSTTQLKALSATLGQASATGSRTGTGALAVAEGHLRAMDQALKRAQPISATVHAAAAQAWSIAALNGKGVRPYVRTADADRDGLPDGLELSLGTNPLVKDTDGDGITDGPEAEQLLGLADPTRADTDGNGRADGSEDPDGDSLTVLVELARGTNPLAADGDQDGLDDAAELRLGTNPRVADTDGDTLLDGAEQAAGLNPLRPDSDGDGVPDAQETVSQPVVTDSGARLSVVGQGDVAGGVSVAKAAATQAETQFGAVSDTYDLTLAPGRGTFTQARLTLPYTAAPAGTNPADLRIFTYDEATARWIPTGADLQLDAAARTVSVTITHFSRYAIFDIRNWGQQWSSVGAGCTVGDDPLPADVALVLDSSGSMTSNDPLGLRRTAAKQFVAALTDTDRASVTDFDDSAVVRQALTSDQGSLNAAIDRIDDVGGTNISAGFSAGLGTLPAPSDTRVNAMILLTDGQGAWDTALIAQARAKRTPVFTIGLGTGPDAALLQGIAAQTEGQYFGVSSADQLPRVFRSIAGCVNDPTPGTGVSDPACAGPDTDGDGLRDCLETGGMALGNGTVVTTDPAKPDTDGDGLTDGDEMGVPSSVPGRTATAFQASSNPTLPDSDADGLTMTMSSDTGPAPSSPTRTTTA